MNSRRQLESARNELQLVAERYQSLESTPDANTTARDLSRLARKKLIKRI